MVVGLGFGARASWRRGRRGLAHLLGALALALAASPAGCVALYTPVSDEHGRVWKPRLVDDLALAWGAPFLVLLVGGLAGGHLVRKRRERGRADPERRG